MINVNDLWIGDVLRVISSGRIGTYEGLGKVGKLRINSEGKIFLVHPKNVEIYTVPEKKPLIKFDDEFKSQEIDFTSSIDLHIEVLNPSLINALPERILDYQVKAFEDYISKAKERKEGFVVIVHGKGTGVLKGIVESYLKSDPHIWMTESNNNGGAVRVTFSKVY